MAPAASDSGRVLTTRLGSKNWMTPRPSHFRAGAHRVVEGKQARLQFLQANSADRAGELGRETGARRCVVHLQRDGAAFGVAQRGLEGFGQALAHVVAHLQAVDDDVDGVLLRFASLGTASIS